ncbi:MFS general substrate transporter [Hypoxylon sp. FL0890]|nr:MFS general substrate transporter [Hypoxylon sp. FL0890]
MSGLTETPNEKSGQNGPLYASVPVARDAAARSESSLEAGILAPDKESVIKIHGQTSIPVLDFQDQTQRLPFPRLISAYLCLSALYFISQLDINSVATALPTISTSLNAGNTITWTGTAYVMGQTAFQPLYGRFSDIFGRKIVLMICIVFLIGGDLLGIGGGGINSLVQITASDLVSLRDRGKYQGILSCATGLGASTGPFIAAAIMANSSDGWRWIFWVPPILATVCMALTWIWLPLKPVTGRWSEKIQKIDWLGLFTVVIGIAINSGGSTFPWTKPIIISLLVLGGTFIILFGVVEVWIAKIPMIPLRLFTKLSTSIIFLQSVLYNGVWQINLYFLPMYFQDVRGYDPLKNAKLMLSLLLTQSVSALVAGQIISKLGRQRFYRPGPVLFGGLALWTLGAGLKILFSRTTPVSVYVISLIIEGVGIGCNLQPALVALQALSRPEDRAVATSTRNLMRMLGSVFGLAIATTVQFQFMKLGLSDAIPPALRSRVIEGLWQKGEPGSEMWESDILDAKLNGVHAVFIMTVPMMALCLLGCFLIPSIRLKGDPKSTDDEEKKEQE